MVQTQMGDSTRLVAAAVAGRTLSEIAAAAGISVSTVQRRLKEPEIAGQIRSARSQQRHETLGQLHQLSARAVARLGELVEHEPAVSLRAISLVLGSSAKMAMAVDIDERLTELEAAVAAEDDEGESSDQS